ncbi:phenylacetaldoxime dehydratase family protein [Corynebacterium pacaense]|uniref:phenylacetaldoxime dehydratase family protein n=1 Tax=Corynebacterium pacaense TaxID=1816684 RepID=UPI0009B9508B|nr:phenylacetaldoxime dehydratase family protein [Corynebacterium pacaense]
MTWTIDYPRRIAERRPEGHAPRAPRWTLGFDQPTSLVTSDYLALQVEDMSDPAVGKFVELAGKSRGRGTDHGPQAHEMLTYRDSLGMTNLIALGYWLDATEHARWLQSAALPRWFDALDPATVTCGAWHEVVQVPLDRMETVYSDPDRPFGMAACEGTRRVPTTTNGYYGAARDRFPVSAIDRLEAPGSHRQRNAPPNTLGRRLRAEVGLNAIVIRSGQYWQESDSEQREDYEQELQPKLMAGMGYLKEHAGLEDVLSLRVMTSLDEETLAPRRETSVLGHFARLGTLENWAESHATHAAIFEHAIRKKQEYGDARSVVTWHEVFALQSSTTYEYVNCHGQTGLLSCSPVLLSVER